MLRDKDRVITPRRLPAVIWRVCRGQSLLYEIGCVLQHDIHSLGGKVVSLLLTQSDSAAKR